MMCFNFNILLNVGSFGNNGAQRLFCFFWPAVCEAVPNIDWALQVPQVLHLLESYALLFYVEMPIIWCCFKTYIVSHDHQGV